MGGGNSKKDKAQVIAPNQGAMQQAGSSQFAAPIEKGPSSKPNFGEPSPAQSQSSKIGGLQRNESQEMDGATPNQQAKQMIAKLNNQNSLPPPAAMSVQSASPSPAPSPKKVESQADRSEMLAKQKRDMEAKRQRQLEEEKMRKLQLINEQQKAKKAAAAAAAAAEATKKKQQQQQEVFASHNDSQGRQESQSNELNSPPKRGQRKNDDNIDLSVNGAGLNRAESKPAMAVAPVAQVQFKVVQYHGDKLGGNNNIGGNPWAAESNPYQQNQGTIDNATPIHFGVMNQNNSKNDSEADRNINMSDLNELLGI